MVTKEISISVLKLRKEIHKFYYSGETIIVRKLLSFFTTYDNLLYYQYCNAYISCLSSSKYAIMYHHLLSSGHRDKLMSSAYLTARRETMIFIYGRMILIMKDLLVVAFTKREVL